MHRIAEAHVETEIRPRQLTAFEIMISNPPRPSVASVTMRSQSCNTPTSCPNSSVKGCKESKQSPTHAFDNERLDLVFFLHFPGHLVRSLLIRIVIDGDIAAFSSEFLGYKSTQTSAFVAMSTMVCRADGCNDPTDLEPPVIRALRPLRLYGIVWNRGASRSRAWRDLIRWH